MSDFTLLYKKYSTISNLTNELNGAVIILKRRNMATDEVVMVAHPKIQVQPEEVEQASKELLGILAALEVFYEKPDIDNYLFPLADNKLFKTFILENAEYKEHIKVSVEKLRRHKNLTNKELVHVDRFVSILDNEASGLYRKLRSTRG